MVRRVFYPLGGGPGSFHITHCTEKGSSKGLKNMVEPSCVWGRLIFKVQEGGQIKFDKISVKTMKNVFLDLIRPILTVFGNLKNFEKITIFHEIAHRNEKFRKIFFPWNLPFQLIGRIYDGKRVGTRKMSSIGPLEAN